jgi:flagellar hook assembly protein FlgD
LQIITLATSVNTKNLTSVETFELFHNYPNPFNPSTKISYTLPVSAEVELSVFNTLGQRVRTLVQQHQDAGLQTVTWNGTDDNGQNVSGGLYFFKIIATGKTNQYNRQTKGILLK